MLVVRRVVVGIMIGENRLTLQELIVLRFELEITRTLTIDSVRLIKIEWS